MLLIRNLRVFASVTFPTRLSLSYVRFGSGIGYGDDEEDPNNLDEQTKKLWKPDDIDALTDIKSRSVQPAKPPSLQWIRDTDDLIDKELAERQAKKEEGREEAEPIEPVEGAIALFEDPPQLEDIGEQKYFEIMKPHVDALPNLLGGRRPQIPSADFDEVDMWGSADLDESFWQDNSEALIDENEMINDKALAIAANSSLNQSIYDRCLLSIDRRVKVTKSGRVAGISALTAVGNRNGVAGFGIGRGSSSESAQSKSFRRAERNLLFLPRLHEQSLLHNVNAKCGGTQIIIHAVHSGRGIRCSKLIRCVMELFGVRNLTAKVFGSSNPYNVVRALFTALANMSDYGTIRAMRGLKSVCQEKRLPPRVIRLPEGFDAVKTPQNIKRILRSMKQQSH